MTRVSLREAYDNKDVVAQIYAIRDTAESAEDTAEQAVTTANTASDHVDALVPQVEGAVANANSASASAQASAQTVAGYENRLATVESDLNAVTLRVTTAEGQIVTIQGRVTALETADGQNVKLTGNHAIGNYAVLLTDNQTVRGLKTFRQGGAVAITNFEHTSVDLNIPVSVVQNAQFLKFADGNSIELATLMIQRRVDNGVTVYIHVRNADGTYKYIPLGAGDA